MENSQNQISQLEAELTAARAEIERLKKYQLSLEAALAKDLSDDDEMGCEFVYVNTLKDQLTEARACLKNQEASIEERDKLIAKLKTRSLKWDKYLKKLDGVAAVNLSEPSGGDLERVVKAYSLERKITAMLRTDLIRAINTLKMYGCGDFQSDAIAREAEMRGGK